MPDHSTIPNPLEARLDAWGQAERARISEPAPRFLAAVRAAQPKQPALLARRLTVLLAAAAAIALAAFVAFRPAPAPTELPGTNSHANNTHSARGTPERIFTAGRGRELSIDDIMTALDTPPAPTTPAAAPVRAADAYCAGCIEELTRI